MPTGSLVVFGADPAWLAALTETLSDSGIRVEAGDPCHPSLMSVFRDRAELVLMYNAYGNGPPEPADLAAGSLRGGADWVLLPARDPQVPSELPEPGVILAGGTLPADEVGRRVRTWLQNRGLLARQRAIADSLAQAQRVLEGERESLRLELARLHERVERSNQELTRRVDELSRLNRDLEHLEELNANVIEALQESLVACDESGMLTHWSQGATELLGWERQEVLGRPISQFVRAPEPEASLLLDLLRRAEGRRLHRLRLLTQKNEVRPVELRATALHGRTGEVRGTVLLLTDQVKQQRTEEHIRRRDRLASLGELSAGMAHEIRNPLAGIGTTAELLRSRLPTGAPEVEFVDVILEEVGRLEKIIADLLSFARPGKPRPVRGDLHRILDRMVFLLRRQISRRGIQVIKRYDRTLPGVELDPDQTLQLLLNVGLNAVEAMEGGGKLTLITEPVTAPEPGNPEEAERRWVRISVQDTGPGVPPEIRDKVFNPFFTTKRRGSGLGLAICQRIVEDQRGTIYLDSSPGQPTTLVVDFPLDAPAQSAEGQTELFAAGPSPQARPAPEEAREA